MSCKGPPDQDTEESSTSKPSFDNSEALKRNLEETGDSYRGNCARQDQFVSIDFCTACGERPHELAELQGAARRSTPQ